MKPIKLVLGTLAYAAVTFPLAYAWHLVFFKETYERLGYFGRHEPIIAFGFLAILTQGVLLSLIYSWLWSGSPRWAGTLQFLAVMGGYHWTTHVLAAAAKNPIDPLSTWFTIESAYLAIQFALAGMLLAQIFAKKPAPQAAIPQHARTRG